MGYYIQTPANTDKAGQLVKVGAEIQAGGPPAWPDIPEDKALVCVVHNGMFDAAALVYSEDELRDFNLPQDTRTRTWLLMEKAQAHQLAGYTA